MMSKFSPVVENEKRFEWSFVFAKNINNVN